MTNPEEKIPDWKPTMEEMTDPLSKFKKCDACGISPFLKDKHGACKECLTGLSLLDEEGIAKALSTKDTEILKLKTDNAELVKALNCLKDSLPNANAFHQAFGWDSENKQLEQYRNEVHHLIAVDLPDFIDHTLSQPHPGDEFRERLQKAEELIDTLAQYHQTYNRPWGENKIHPAYLIHIYQERYGKPKPNKEIV